MKDPFGLLSVKELTETQEKAKPQPKRTYLIVISILVGLVLLCAQAVRASPIRATRVSA